MAARRQQKVLEQLKHKRNRRLRAKFPALPKNTAVIATPPGEHKMSQVILDFLEPLWNRESPPDERRLQRLLQVGMMAWNAAIQGDEGKAIVQAAAATMPVDLRDDFLVIVNGLIGRKEAHFADIRRVIIDFRLTWDPIRPQVAIISTLV